MTRRVPPMLVEFVAFAVLLLAVAWLAPAPKYETDREIYEAIGRRLIVPDCSGLHCFRPLVPWIVDRFPGPSIVHWKIYAALLNAVAAVATGRLARAFGLTPFGSRLAAAMSAFGFGAMFTLFDPHTADPFMFAAAPLIFTELWVGRLPTATALSTLAVFGKEFGAAALWIFTAFAAIGRQWRLAVTTWAAANFVTLVWVALQLGFVLVFNYTYGGSASTDLLHGGYMRYWLSHMSLRSAVASVFTVYGALYVLFAVALLRGSVVPRRLVVAAAPAVVALCYVQQPDRALWNFHFLVVPMAATVLERMRPAAAWSFVAVFALASLRSGAQIPIGVPATAMTGLALAIAAIGATTMARPGTAPAGAAA